MWYPYLVICLRFILEVCESKVNLEDLKKLLDDAAPEQKHSDPEQNQSEDDAGGRRNLTNFTKKYWEAVDQANDLN